MTLKRTTPAPPNDEPSRSSELPGRVEVEEEDDDEEEEEVEEVRSMNRTLSPANRGGRMQPAAKVGQRSFSLFVASSSHFREPSFNS